jgi:hypothetical protein
MKNKFPETIDNALNEDHLVQLLYDRMFDKYYSGSQLNDWQRINFFGGGNAQKYKDEIKRLLIEGKRVKTGYKASSAIRGHATFYIFYKDPK